MNKLLPFDLEAALKGAKVVTRDGRAVTGLHRFEGVTGVFVLVGVMDGGLQSWKATGEFHHLATDPPHRIDHACDLFMAPLEPKKLVYWVNFYENGEGYAWSSRKIADSKAGHRAPLRIGGKARKVVLEVSE